MSTDSTSSPSERRWTAFSVRHAVRVGGPRSPRRCRSGTPRRAPPGAAAGRVRISSNAACRPRHAASSTWRARYAGWPRSANQAASSSGARPPMPGRSSRGPVAEGAGRSPKNGVTTGRSSVIAPMMTRVGAGLGPATGPAAADPARGGHAAGPAASPRRTSGACPGGVTPLEDEAPVDGGERRPAAVPDEGPRPVAVLRRRDGRRGHDEALPVRARGTCRATAGRRGPGARARRPAARGRAGRPRAGAGGSASRRRPAGARPPARRAATARGTGRAARRRPRPAAPRGRARARRPRAARRTRATTGPVSSPVVHAHEA